MAYQQQPQIPPAVVQWFRSVDVDGTGTISAIELQQALTNNDWSHFQLNTCYQMITLFDRTYTGQINMYDFHSLTNFLNQWRQVFDANDQDRSGTISEHELHATFGRIGFNLSPNFVRMAMWRYDTLNRRCLTFEGFINCCLMLQSLTRDFQQRDTAKQGSAQIGYDDFMCMAINNLK
uniref:Peflin-like n=1 Tax=Phallusia mammillata TaxID=59560 RepID=A0A6F9DMU4_9ASCI|nr:peflin-like [Phallusia mammillata]